MIQITLVIEDVTTKEDVIDIVISKRVPVYTANSLGDANRFVDEVVSILRQSIKGRNLIN